MAKLTAEQIESMRPFLEGQAAYAIFSVSKDLLCDYILHDGALPKYTDRIKGIVSDMEKLQKDITLDLLRGDE